MKITDFEDLPEDVQSSMQQLGVMEPSEGLALMARVAGDYPGFVLGRLNLAAIQLEEQGADAAQATYEAVLSDFPDEDGATGGLAVVWAAKGDFAKAEALARQAIENGYRWPPCYSVIAQAYEARGETEAAAEGFLTAYRLSPHSWQDLEHYCRLSGRNYVAPDAEVPPPVALETLKELFPYIDKIAHTPDSTGDIPGCDHSFRFTTEWAEEHGVDVIALYQFLNAHGGFCDCEACFNVEPALFEADDEPATERVPITIAELDELKKAIPGLPDDYLGYMRSEGWGRSPNGCTIYSGPIQPEQIYGDQYKGPAVVLLGDDDSGSFLGYELSTKQYGEVDESGKWQPWQGKATFSDFIESD